MQTLAQRAIKISLAALVACVLVSATARERISAGAATVPTIDPNKYYAVLLNCPSRRNEASAACKKIQRMVGNIYKTTERVSIAKTIGIPPKFLICLKIGRIPYDPPRCS